MRSSTSLPVSGTWTAIASSGATTTSHTVASLTNGTRYYFQVRATNANGNSNASNTATIQLAASPATAVTISDTNLRANLESATGKASGATITQLDMAKLQGSLFALEEGRGVTSLTGLEYAVNVVGLSLGGCRVSALTPLASLTALEYLDFFRCGTVSDLMPLASLTALHTLGLQGNRVTNLTPLAGLTSLTTLNLRNNDFTDITPLAGLTALETLILTDNAISDFTPLASLTALQILHIWGLRIQPIISDLTPLAGLTALRELWLSNNDISDLTPLVGLTALEELHLASNEISDLTPLAGLTALEDLRLYNNAISNLSPLAGLTSLRYLDLRNNQIADLTPLAGLTSLTFLRLGNLQFPGLNMNMISDVAPLAANAGIGSGDEVYLGNNPLSSVSVYVHIPVMQQRGATVHFDALPEPPPPNMAPEVVRTLDDAALAAGERLTVDLLGVFTDADGETLTFSATSSQPAVATAGVDRSSLTVAALVEGQARVTVRAADPHGATASLSFLVTVGNPVSIGSPDGTAGLGAVVAAVPEGGVAEVLITMAAARTVDVSFAYSFGPDGDPATADADAADHGGEGGTVTIAAGETTATISVPIADDDDIEPAREAFAVTLTPMDGVGVAVSSAVVHIAEGVCDRTWQVADALRGGRACEAVTPAELVRRRTMRLKDTGLAQLQPLDFLGLAGLTVLILDDNGLSSLPEGLLAGSPKLRVLRLRGNRFETLPTLGSAPALIELDLTSNLLAELPSKAFADLPALGYLYLGENEIETLPADLLAETSTMRILELQDNALEALPEGLFAGVPKLVSLQLQGNPGAPFPLAVEFARVEAGGEAGDEQEAEEEPGRAEIQLRVPHGAPFAINAEISAPGATLSAQTATIAAGETLGDPVSVVRNVAGNEADAAVTVEITSAPNLPTTTCGDDYDEYRCFRGFELRPSTPLTLFEPSTSAQAPFPAMR